MRTRCHEHVCWLKTCATQELCAKRNQTTEDIALSNEARLRGMGYSELQDLLNNFYVRAKGVGSSGV